MIVVVFINCLLFGFSNSIYLCSGLKYILEISDVWILLIFDDGLVSVQKGMDVTHIESGSSAQDVQMSVGQRCAAPFKKKMYEGKVLFITGKFI